MGVKGRWKDCKAHLEIAEQLKGIERIDKKAQGPSVLRSLRPKPRETKEGQTPDIDPKAYSPMLPFALTAAKVELSKLSTVPECPHRATANCTTLTASTLARSTSNCCE